MTSRFAGSMWKVVYPGCELYCVYGLQVLTSAACFCQIIEINMFSYGKQEETVNVSSICLWAVTRFKGESH